MADASQTIFNTGSEDACPDLYKILDVASREATDAEIRSAYRKQALRYHPDKISSTRSDEEKLQARQAFDQVGLAYKILSDPKLRQRYDTTGKTDENPFLDGLDDQASWSAYFKDLWSGEVNAQTIEEFANKYRDSEEELDDLRRHYQEFEGSLDEILAHTMCATDDCEPRLIKRIDKLIKDGVLSSTATWQKSKKDTKARAKRQKTAAQESKEAEALAKELGVHEKLYGKKTADTTNGLSTASKKGESPQESEDGLQALIRANAAKKHEALIARLEAKALAESSTNKSSKSRGKKRKGAADIDDDDEEAHLDPATSALPTEDQFQKIQAGLLANKKTKKDTKSGPARPSSSSTKKKKSKS